jgi:phage/plasmid-associated DNA primase
VAAVSRATEEYFKDEDLVQQFVEDCLEVGGNGFASNKELHDCWVVWWVGQGQDPRYAASMDKLGKQLERLGIPKWRVGNDRGRACSIKDGVMIRWGG